MPTTPTFFSTVRVVAAKDLRLEAGRPDALISSGIFSLVILVLFHFSLDSLGPEKRAEWLPGLLWTVLSFASIVGMARSFRDEQTDDTMGAMLQAPIDRTAIYLGKLVVNLVRMAILGALLTPLTLIAFPAPLPGGALPLLVPLLLFGFCLTVLGTFFSAITSRLRRGEALLAVLVIPAAVPVLLGAIRCTQSALIDGTLSGVVVPWVALGGGFAGLYFFLSLAVFEFIVED